MLNLLGAGHAEVLRKKTQKQTAIQQHMFLVVVGQKWRREGISSDICTCTLETVRDSGRPCLSVWKRDSAGHYLFCKILFV